MNRDIMKQAGFEKEVMMFENSVCPTCCRPINLSNGFTPTGLFRNAKSWAEFEISGMCQKCQDEFFGVD